MIYLFARPLYLHPNTNADIHRILSMLSDGHQYVRKWVNIVVTLYGLWSHVREYHEMVLYEQSVL